MQSAQWNLYAVYWSEGEETKKGFAKSLTGATNEMRRRLKEGYPAWIVKLTEEHDDDLWDDIPF